VQHGWDQFIVRQLLGLSLDLFGLLDFSFASARYSAGMRAKIDSDKGNNGET
jgi:hypothetical protein